MKKLVIAFLAALAVPPAAIAAATDIAQLPVLDIGGTGSIKPNIMLLLDNSGSMDWNYMPDFVGGGQTSGNTGKMCRTGALLSGGTVACAVGDPPFTTSDFNGIYYNPSVYYQPPITASGTSYNSMTSANTTGWTVVKTDGYGIQNNDMFGNTTATTNLVTGFPDKLWKTSTGTTCGTNTSYTYPNASCTTSSWVYGAPYYYSINTQEYCTDDTLSACQSVTAGSSAPGGYPKPAKVRWCSNSNQTTGCQAKYSTTSYYPRFSVGLPGVVSYGTITIGPTTTATKAGNGIATATVNGTSIISGSVSTANYAPNTANGQKEMAIRLAGKINATPSTAVGNFIACVNSTSGISLSPSAGSVETCDNARYGLPVNTVGNNVVVVIPANCTSATKPTSCTSITDSSYAGDAIAATSRIVTVTPATAAVNPTGVITFSGTTVNAGAPTLINNLTGSVAITLGGTAVYSGAISLGKNRTAIQVASTIVTKIGTSGTIKGYVGGNAITATCASKTTASVCLVDTNATITNGKVIAIGTLSGVSTTPYNASGLGVPTLTNTAGGAPATAAVTDSVAPLTGSSIAAGGGSPDPFTRVDIVSTRATYPKASTRSDCTTTAGVCTYAEEMTNFANWYTYYHTRMQMMKSSAGLAFSALGGSYRVGFAKLSTMGPSGSGTPDMLPADYSGANRTNWYSKLYAANPSGSTPLREALNGIGNMYKSTTNGVISYPCQQNYTILTTDGYWNNIAYAGGVGVQNNDNVENAARFCTKIGGCYDGKANPAAAPSLADVALYWYNGGANNSTLSLRSDLEPNMSVPGVVPANSADPNTHLHMSTFTLGLGVNGNMTYEPNYDTAPVIGGNYYKLVTTATGCPWNGGGTYIWPDPVGDTQTTVDDLWHAGVNGHGKYFSARDPQAVVTGLATALASMTIRMGAASAAATSTPNVSQQDNDIFSATFTTVLWYGELFAQKVDPATGNVQSAINETSTNTLGLQVAAATDTRSIKMLDTATGGLKDFKYSAMNATEQSWFNNKGSSMVQYGSLSAPNQAIANSGTNLVNWLRGQTQYSDGDIYRAYTLSPTTAPTNFSGTWHPGIPIVLGDIDTAKPAYLRKALKKYPETTAATTAYSTFVSDQSTRQATVFAAANDGMLHAFDAASFTELWAYAPRITMSKLYKQAAIDYGANHQFTVDGSPEIADVKIGGTWKSVLVGGLNAGGRGYYALDVTVPAAPVPLWEFCADSAICAKNDPDMGLTYGNPQFGYWHNQWVVMVTSGYNNIPGTDGVATGDGKGYLYVLDVETGNKLAKISTGVGDTTTPSGFAKITAITNNPQTDPDITYVYGGDNLGNLFRFDFTDPTFATVPKVTLATVGSSKPITTRPDVGLCQPTGSTTQERVVLIGTGRLLGVSDTTSIDPQSVYVIKDTGTALGNLNTNATMVKQTLSTLSSSSFTITTNSVDLTLGNVNGWFTDLDLHPGERVNLDPKIAFNTAAVVSNLPTSGSACSVGGTSYDYQFDLCSGSYTDAVTHSVGGILSNTSAAVGFIIIKLASGSLKMITTTADGGKTTSPVPVTKTSAPRKSGWRSIKN